MRRLLLTGGNSAASFGAFGLFLLFRRLILFRDNFSRFGQFLFDLLPELHSTTQAQKHNTIQKLLHGAL